ncbi:DUF1885 family protein [Hazenella sp. IB182357]|uniref:DUF1885 family protein n=1 Tax=Polycladospora coralii TaxID=2771432 RepID=A0A926N7S6_9BACL|nr:DUF1885 family protein [Polycladospora coralii]MBD1371272.1 DUF1885 family protein [Polycladospora coralii]MBS7530227.1 DUF1885 family protein [Polycladospora coralii]
MSKSAYIKLVPGSKQTEISLNEVKELLHTYQERTRLTGTQLDWDYADAAFPYRLEEKEQDGQPYLLLNGKGTEHYEYFIIGTGTEAETEVQFIQIVLPSQATHGDLGKVNEYAKWLAKALQGELHMLNGRIMYFNDRKSR